MADRSGYVYLFVGVEGRCKIGFSKNPERRLRDFHAAGLFELRLAVSWRSDLARLIEVRAHKELAARKIAGEWFAIPEDVAKATVDRLHSLAERGELTPVTAPKRAPLTPADRTALAKRRSDLSIQKRQAAIRERLSLIKREWALGQTRTSTLLQQAGVSYAAARRELGPRRKYQARSQETLFPGRPRINVTANAEKTRAQAGCARIADKWKSGAGRTADLLEEAGVSKNTAILYLGKRPGASSGVRPPGGRRVRRSTWKGPEFPVSDPRSQMVR